MAHIAQTSENLQCRGNVRALENENTVMWHRIEGGIILLLAIIAYREIGASWLLFAGLLLLPDLSAAGYLFGPRKGAFIYNTCHTYSLPGVFLCAGILTGLSPLTTLSVIWIAHIGMDRVLGYGLKLSRSFKHTDLKTL